MIQLPTDGGPIYAETDFSSFFVEPWNSISSFAIVIPAIYWAVRLRFNIKNFSFLYSCILLLILGGTGSVLYHAFRSSQLLLMMDVLPAVALTILIAAYFWFKVVPNWFQALSITFPFVIIRFSLFEFLPSEYAVNVGYFISGAMFFVPILIYLNQHQFHFARQISLSIGFLFISLIFRELDHTLTLYIPIGSHFLWHIFSGFGAYYLGGFLFKLRKEELASKTNEVQNAPPGFLSGS